MNRFLLSLFCVLCGLMTAESALAQRTPALGIRAGWDSGPDNAYLGLQTEFGRIPGGASIAPSLDVELGDGSSTIVNGDLRWYLLPLPETGIQIYGAAGPGLVLSPDTELGLNLAAGLHIPMKGGRRYNMEARFGFGDVPDFKLGASIVFAF